MYNVGILVLVAETKQNVDIKTDGSASCDVQNVLEFGLARG
jgi:hypothetical protein